MFNGSRKVRAARGFPIARERKILECSRFWRRVILEKGTVADGVRKALQFTLEQWEIKRW